MTQTSITLPSTTVCLSENDVVGFAAGSLSPSEREAAHLHLDGCENCRTLLDEAVRAMATAPTQGMTEHEEIAWRATFRPGSVVGQRYEIRRFIARGGMGEVYEAFDRDLQERVALKTVTSTACDNPDAVKRLKAEVQLARRVSHPCVCRIYDFGTHAVAGTGALIAFLTMEFVDGETLGQRVRSRGALPLDEALSLARQLLLGLSAAHDAGVLHRDFKSDNVMLRSDGEIEHALILDFGLARALDHVAGHSSSAQQGLLGTLAYLAPEQLEGNPYSRASDLYSFGLVWYEMLTGQLPFKSGSSPARTTLERLTRRVPAPSSSNPRLSRDIDAIVLGCLRREPADRFQTASEILQRLEHLAGSTRSQRRKPVVALLATTLVGMAVASYLATGARSSARAQSARATVRAHQAPQGLDARPAELALLPPAPQQPDARLEPTAPLREGTRPAPVRKLKSRDSNPTSSSGDARPVPTSPQPGWENPFVTSQPGPR